MCESFFATLECELIERESFADRSDARLAVFDYVETSTTRAVGMMGGGPIRRFAVGLVLSIPLVFLSFQYGSILVLYCTAASGLVGLALTPLWLSCLEESVARTSLRDAARVSGAVAGPE